MGLDIKTNNLISILLHDPYANVDFMQGVVYCLVVVVNLDSWNVDVVFCGSAAPSCGNGQTDIIDKTKNLSRSTLLC